MSQVLRPYQSELERDIYAAWSPTSKNVLAVLPTGGGKTTVFSKVLTDFNGASCALAHRSELVGQMAMALARNGVRHSVLASKPVIREIVAMQMDEFGRSYYDPSARTRVAGVDTLVRLPKSDMWLPQVGLCVCDEGHHLLRENKWGRGVGMFPNSYLLSVTATPVRADGKGLGREADGVIDKMVIGPGMRDLIEAEYLCPYRIFAPPNDLNLDDVSVTDSGEFSPEPLRKAVHRSTQIVGDVVKHYLRLASGKLGITFAVDVESATEIAQAFRDAGVPAEVLTGNTPTTLRAQIMRRFRRREILQIVNVDILGEGTDVPAVEVVSFARPTQSFGLYVQQFGRAMRIMLGKTHAIIIDHVGNWYRHGRPDADREWSLARRERSAAKKEISPMRVCLKCTGAYDRVEGLICPYCKHEEIIAGRSKPEFVDGDLYEVDLEALKDMRAEIQRIDDPPFIPKHLDALAAAGVKRQHWERQEAQKSLRLAIAEWGGVASVGREDYYQRKFFLTFKLDVFSAMALGRPGAQALEAKIRKAMQ